MEPQIKECHETGQVYRSRILPPVLWNIFAFITFETCFYILWYFAISASYAYQLDFFLIGIVGGGVQLGPLGTAATIRPLVPAPGDYDDGEIVGMIGRGNRST
jgi:hypothetical protein